MWVLVLVVGVTVCGGEERWSRPAERRQGDWVPLLGPDKEVLNTAQQNTVIPRALQPSHRFEHTFGPRLVNPQPFLDQSRLQPQNQYLSHQLPPHLINRHFLPPGERPFLLEAPIPPNPYLNRQNAFAQADMRVPFEIGNPLPPLYQSGLQGPPSEGGKASVNGTSRPLSQADKEKEEVQILYVPVETLKQRARGSPPQNDQRLNYFTTPREESGTTPPFKHPIQPLRDQVPAQVNHPESYQTYKDASDNAGVQSLNGQEYVIPTREGQYRASQGRHTTTEEAVYRKASPSGLGDEGETRFTSTLRSPLRDDYGQIFRDALPEHRVEAQSEEATDGDIYQTEGNFVKPARGSTPTLPPPNQPPLSVYMETDPSSKVDNVLSLLKGAKTIPVLDSIGPDSPQVFVGPSNLNPPEGYVKFELPYLSSLESERVEKRVDSLPFFVAPLNFQPPPGYSKIPFPAPHIGSVVVSNATSLRSTQKGGEFPPARHEKTRNQYVIPSSISPISPQLPSLINGLQEDKYISSVESVPLTTTDAPATVYTRTQASRRPQLRGSQRGYTTTTPTTTTTRRQHTRQRRPYNNRNYTPRQQSEPLTTTTQQPFYPEKYINSTDSLQLKNKETEAPLTYSAENEQDYRLNSQAPQYSEESDYQTQYRNQAGIKKYQQSPLIEEDPVGVQTYSKNKDRFVSDELEENSYRTGSTTLRLPVANIQTTTETQAPRHKARLNPESYSEEESPPNHRLQYAEPVVRTKYYENRSQFQSAVEPESSQESNSNIKHSGLVQSFTRQNENPSAEYSGEQITQNYDVPTQNNNYNYQNQFHQEKVLNSEEAVPRRKLPNKNYESGSNRNLDYNSQEQIRSDPTSETPRQSLRQQFVQRQELEQPPTTYLTKQPQALEYQTAQKNIEVPESHISEEITESVQIFTTTPPPVEYPTSTANDDESYLNQRVHSNHRLNRYRSKGQTKPETKSVDTYEGSSRVATENPIRDYQADVRTEKSTARPVSRIRGRVRGRVRAQPRETTTTEAPNYPVNVRTNVRTEYKPDKSDSSKEKTYPSDGFQVQRYPERALENLQKENEEEETSTTVPSSRVNTGDRNYDKKTNFRNQRRPQRPTTTTTTSAPGTRYLIRTRRPNTVQTRLHTGRSRIRKPTTAPPTTTTPEPPTTLPNVWTVRNNLPQTPSSQAPVPIYRISPLMDYDTEVSQPIQRQSYESGSKRGGSQYDSTAQDGAGYSPDRRYPDRYESSEDSTYDRVEKEDPSPRPTGQEGRVRYREKAVETEEGSTQRGQTSYKSQSGDEEARKKAEEYWNEAVTIQQSKSYVYTPEDSVITSPKPSAQRTRGELVSRDSSPAYGDYEDYYNFQETSQHSSSDQAPFASIDRQIYSDVKPSVLDNGKPSQYPVKEEFDVAPNPMPKEGFYDEVTLPSSKVSNPQLESENEPFRPSLESENEHFRPSLESENETTRPNLESVENNAKSSPQEESNNVSTSKPETDLLNEEGVEKEKHIKEAPGKKTTRRRGSWVRVRVRKPNDVFQTAESQSFGLLTSNSLQPLAKEIPGVKIWKGPLIQKPENSTSLSEEGKTNAVEETSSEEPETTTQFTTESITEAAADAYETTVPNLTTDINNIIEQTTNPSTLSALSNDSDMFTTEVPYSITSVNEISPSKIIGTSTTTEISLETEICYRGRCVKTKRTKGLDSSDLMPIE